jgi:two-component system, NtrC family, response regulator AtoC
MKYRILVVDDDLDNLRPTCALLEQWGYAVESAASGTQGVSMGSTGDYAVILMDYRMPDINGAEAAIEIRKRNEESIIIMYSCDESREALKDALRADVMDFVDKNEDLNKFRAILEDACTRYEESSRTVKQSTSPTATEELILSVGMIGRSHGMAEVSRKIIRYKNRKETVLILGATGTGKERVARALHTGDPEKFKVVDCTVYRDKAQLLEAELYGSEKGAYTNATARRIGIIEAARGGTVFFDELHQLSLDAQTKLLRAFQEKKIRRVGGQDEYSVDFRIIAAAQSDLEERVAAGSFLPDLFHRLNILRIEVPSLQERPEDIEPLVAHFCEAYNKANGQKKRFLMQTVRYMERKSWPGNIRDLQNMIYRMLTDSASDTIRPEALGPTFKTDIAKIEISAFSALKHKHELEIRDVLTEAMRISKTASQAAERLGMPATTLYSMLNKYGLRKECVG